MLWKIWIYGTSSTQLFQLSIKLIYHLNIIERSLPLITFIIYQEVEMSCLTRQKELNGLSC